MTEVYCKDCANSIHITTSRGVLTLGCMLTESTTTDVVTGKVKKYYVVCRDARTNRGMCGPDGKLFRAKPKPWWRFWS